MELNSKELRKEAYEAAGVYYRARPLRTVANPYPRPVDYARRLTETQRFQQAYMERRRKDYALAKLSEWAQR
jgi:hypothetical protein